MRLRGQRLMGAPDAVRVEVEAALVLAQRGLREAGALVEHRQQRQADARVLGGGLQRVAHRERVGVRRAVGLVLQVVELADVGVAAGQQLAVEVRGDGLHVVRGHGAGHAVHAVAPAPEVVARVLAPLRQAGEGALEGVAVRVHQSWQHRSGQRLRIRRTRHARLHGRPAPAAVADQQHVVLPAAVEPGVRRPPAAGAVGVVRDGAHSAAPGVQSRSVCSSARSTGCTRAARAGSRAGGAPGVSSM